MPILDDGGVERRGPELTVRASIPIEVDWALSGVHRLGQSLPPMLETLYQDPELVTAVLGLWGPGEQMSYPGYLELSAMAQPFGLLFTTDSDAFLDRLTEMCVSAPTDLPFLAETPEDKAILLARLATLRQSAARRRRYVDVVTRVWSDLREGWERNGRPAVEAEMAVQRSKAEKAPDYRQFVAAHCAPHTPPEHILDILGDRGEVVVVPAYFARKGLWLDLPGYLIIGTGIADTVARNRAETEELAKRLKALSDPTRLTILHGLAHTPMTVSDIAQRYSLAQPTVSNHIKVLREAGFISHRSDGRSRLITVDEAALAAVAERVTNLGGA
jgi:ArsR family transcriptional regulator